MSNVTAKGNAVNTVTSTINNDDSMTCNISEANDEEVLQQSIYFSGDEISNNLKSGAGSIVIEIKNDGEAFDLKILYKSKFTNNLAVFTETSSPITIAANSTQIVTIDLATLNWESLGNIEKLLEKYVGRDKIVSMLNKEGIAGYTKYPRSLKWHIKFRERINKMIEMYSK